MSKTNKIKGDLDDITELVAIIQVLKDVASNKFHALANRKDRFARFGESFVEFFRMISLSRVQHPLVSNENPATGILILTSETGFMGDLNNRVIRMALNEQAKYPNSVLIVVGKKAGTKLVALGRKVKVFEDLETVGLYQTAINIKDYMIGEIMAGRLGHAMVVYPWSKNFMVQKPRVVKLLPCEQLLTKQADFVDSIERVIEESDPIEIIGHLADMWIVCRVYEMLHDTMISEAAAQSQQLEGSLQKMQKEKKGIQFAFNKGRKADIDKSMREVFTSRLMAKK